MKYLTLATLAYLTACGPAYEIPPSYCTNTQTSEDNQRCIYYLQGKLSTMQGGSATPSAGFRPYAAPPPKTIIILRGTAP